MTNRQKNIHPIEKAKTLDSTFRSFFQNPRKIISKYITPEMNVLDLGCGTGFFTTEIAKCLNNSGKVIAADVQQGMLTILRKKIENQTYRQRVKIFHCPETHLGIKEKFDFILAFYSFHEMKYLDNVIKELSEICTYKGKVLIAEQKFHVPKSFFNSSIEKMEYHHFKIIDKPRIFLSRAVLMERGT